MNLYKRDEEIRKLKQAGKESENKHKQVKQQRDYLEKKTDKLKDDLTKEKEMASSHKSKKDHLEVFQNITVLVIKVYIHLYTLL